MGYSQSQADHSLYVKSNNACFYALLVYDDDVVLAGNYFQEIQFVKHLLNQKLKIKDLGQLRYFLGFEIARSTKGIFLNQRKYILELLEDTRFLAEKHFFVPFDPNLKISLTYSQPLEDPLI